MATFIITAEVSKPPTEILWLAVVTGGVICSKAFLAGQRPSIAYRAALATRRVTFLTEAFSALHQRLALLILELIALNKPGWKWQLAPTEARFREQAGRPYNATLCITFVTGEEQVAEAWAPVRR